MDFGAAFHVINSRQFAANDTTVVRFDFYVDGVLFAQENLTFTLVKPSLLIEVVDYNDGSWSFDVPTQGGALPEVQYRISHVPGSTSDAYNIVLTDFGTDDFSGMYASVWFSGENSGCSRPYSVFASPEFNATIERLDNGCSVTIYIMYHVEETIRPKVRSSNVSSCFFFCLCQSGSPYPSCLTSCS